MFLDSVLELSKIQNEVGDFWPKTKKPGPWIPNTEIISHIDGK